MAQTSSSAEYGNAENERIPNAEGQRLSRSYLPFSLAGHNGFQLVLRDKRHHPVQPINVGTNGIIGDMIFTTFQKVNVTENPRKTPLVLVFQVASYAPLQYKNIQLVFPDLQKRSNFKLAKLKLTKIKRTRFRMANFALYFVKIFVKSFRFDCKFCLV